jgi:hypothetical protein
MVLRGKRITYRLTHTSSGVYNLGMVTAGANKNETPYIFTWGRADFRRGDIFMCRGKTYQIDNVSQTANFGGVIQTQALVTEVFNMRENEGVRNVAHDDGTEMSCHS